MVSRAPRARRDSRTLSPVLLLGAGPGEATCGILYLASYLRRHGIEAFVRLTDADESDEALFESLEALMKRVQPRLVGISLKWFHHVARARLIAGMLKRIDPEVRIVLGGNSASYFWAGVAQWAEVDHVILGDGEAPLLALCRGMARVPNVVTRGATGRPEKPALDYIQNSTLADVHYSHFDELFLSLADLHSFSGWVAPGKGCGENCVYCGGGRGTQKASFGRARPFLRPVEAVQQDHREVAPRAWQFRYDFSGSSAEFLQQAWAELDLSHHSTTYFLWGVPPRTLVEALAARFERVFMVLDIGCFSESQRLDLIGRGLLKPCPTNDELMQVLSHAQQFENLELEISGIAGLPFASEKTLAEERALAERLVTQRCVVGVQRLQSQPGALVTEHPGRFDMVSDASTFDEFLAFFEGRNLAVDTSLPMVRYRDVQFEAEVQAASEYIDELMHTQAERRTRRELTPKTVLQTRVPLKTTVTLGDWLGDHLVPTRLRRTETTVVRSTPGAGLVCAPSLPSGTFEHAAVHGGPEGAALLEALTLFEQPTRVGDAMRSLKQRLRLPAEESEALIEYLATGRFLESP